MLPSISRNRCGRSGAEKGILEHVYFAIGGASTGTYVEGILEGLDYFGLMNEEGPRKIQVRVEE